MSRYDGPDAVERDPTQPYLAALQSWENSVRDRHGIEQNLHMSYVDLLRRYREKCDECDREKRNAVIWEKEQRMSERELNGLKVAVVSLHKSVPARRPRTPWPVPSRTPEPRVEMPVSGPCSAARAAGSQTLLFPLILVTPSRKPLLLPLSLSMEMGLSFGRTLLPEGRKAADKLLMSSTNNLKLTSTTTPNSPTSTAFLCTSSLVSRDSPGLSTPPVHSLLPTMQP